MVNYMIFWLRNTADQSRRRSDDILKDILAVHNAWLNTVFIG